VKHFYTVPTALLDSDPPVTAYSAMSCPGAPQWSLVVVEQWRDHAEQDRWEDLPGVTEHYPEDWGAAAPAAAITAFAPWGATAGMTLRQVLAIVRERWKVCRP
jgi:hypothetical protein